MSDTPAGAALAELRKRAGLSVRDLAAKLDMPSSTYASYERDTFKKPYIPMKLVMALRSLLAGLGDPIITDAEVLQLAGVTGIRAEVPSRKSIVTANGGSIPEIDVLAGAGMGGDALTEAFTDSDGNQVSRDVVKASWGIPEEYRTGVLGVRGEGARIIEIRGDSMAPTLVTGDRVMVDTGDRLASPDGLFAMHDGLSVIVKRLEWIPGSDPRCYKMISDNPRHGAYERTEDELHIIGRVVWLGRKI